MPLPGPRLNSSRRRLWWGLGFAAAVFVAWRIWQPPVVLLQRLDSPDGQVRAFLQRTKYVRDHYRVRISGAGPSYIAYLSPAFTNDFRVDRGERLRWTPDGAALILRIDGRDVWRWDRATARGTDLDPGDEW